jgi:poly(U)-specific endoribonuclease
MARFAATSGFSLFLLFVSLTNAFYVHEAGSIKVSSEDIAEFVTQLQSLDVNAASAGDITVNWQGKTTESSKKDEASEPLFSYVNPKVLTAPTFAAYLALMGTYDPITTQAEHFTADDLSKQEAFLDAVFQTSVMQHTWTFLQTHGVINYDYQSFQSYLKQIWFGLYSRTSSGPLSSSGFEHVYMGEWKGNEVDGLHNWIRFHYLEQSGALNYQGYVAHDGNFIPSIHYAWSSHEKTLSSFFIGTSPEFDLSLFTVCFLTNPNSSGCKFSLGGYNLSVQTYTQQASDGNTYVAATYPNLS